MKKIQMVDTHSQYLKIKDEIDLAISSVHESSNYIRGKEVQLFAEKLGEYLGVEYVIPCGNGTDALQIAMMALGLEPGDEVITPSFTYIATTEVVALLKLKPIFVDVNPITFCMDINSLKKAISPKTKAIVPVHLYGQAAPMEEILKIAKENNLFVVEDNAQALGCDYIFSNGVKKKTGTLGNIGTTSFYPSKNLGAYGDGGALFTRDRELANKIQMIANHGQSKKYHHDMVGCNSRLDSIQAAVLNVKLKYLTEYNLARRKVAEFYSENLSDIEQIKLPGEIGYSTHVFHQYTIKLEDVNREEFTSFLSSKGIPTMIYYPVPGHKQKMFIKNGTNLWDLPVTESLTSKVCSLPIHTEMDVEQLNYIVDSIKLFFSKENN